MPTPKGFGQQKKELVAEAALVYACTGSLDVLTDMPELGGWGWSTKEADDWVRINGAQVRTISEKLVAIVAKEVIL